MRNSKLTKLITVLLAAALLVGVFAMVTVFAEDEQTEGNSGTDESAVSAEVVTKNLNYAARTEIVFGVEAKGVVEGDTVVLLFWNGEQADGNYVYENALYRKTAYGIETIQDVECYLFASHGVVPAEINDSIYVRPVIKHNAGIENNVTKFTYTYGEVVEYNIGMYAAEKLTEVDNTEAQINLYFSLLDYADAAACMFGGSTEIGYTVVQSTSVLGTFGGEGAKFAVPDENGKVLLRAEAKNAKGEYFIKWVNDDGETVLTNRVGTVTVAAKGIVSYTPVYGAKADSQYLTAFDFEAKAVGEVGVATPDLSQAPDKTGYDAFSGTALRLWYIQDKNIFSADSSELRYYAAPLYDTNTEGKETAELYAPIVGEDAKYTLLAREHFYINENEENGDKELLVERSDVIANGWTFYFAQRDSKAQGVEVDLTFLTLNTNGIGIHLSMAVRNSTNSYASSQLRTNLEYNKTNGTFALKAENSSSTKYYASINGETQYFAVKPGETFTVTQRLRLHEATEEDPATLDNTYIDYYINGEFFGSLPIRAFSAFVSNYEGNYPYDLAVLYAYDFYVTAITALKDDVVIDNVCHVK